LERRPGTVLGNIGPNGAAKTTLIDTVTGLTRGYSGSISLDGEAIDGWSAVRRSRAGIGRSLQSLELFGDLTVRDNLRAAADQRDLRAYVTDLVWPKSAPLSPAAVAAVREFKLENDLDRRPNELSYGRRRLVAIARAMAAEPSILLLDEPGAGLDELERVELGQIVRRLATDFGIAVLLVEHDVNLVMSVCDRILVLDFGKPIAEGTPAEVRHNPAVLTAFLGTPDDDSDPTPPNPTSVGSVAR
jgi:sulfate-transporting ATPase